MDSISLPTFNPYDTQEEALSKAVGQLIIAGFEGAGGQVPEAIGEGLRRGEIGGTILFRRNIQDVAQVVDLVESIHDKAREAVAVPWVAVDQEGGRVVRLQAPLTRIPPMREIGRLQDPRLVAAVAEVIATEIGSLGFNLNFAPVLDVDTNPANPVIGDRAFSDSPEKVAQMGGAFLLGHLMAGVVPCGKHFPGHGDTHLDSHKDLPVVEHDLKRLREVELYPFKKAADADFPMLMTAHVKVPVLDTVHPATLSHAMISNLLREKLNYRGVIVSDCLEMKALSDHYSIEESVTLGLRAGVEIFIISHSEDLWKRAHAHLLGLAKRNRLDRLCVINAANRVTKLKRTMLGSLPRPWKRSQDWQAVLGCESHQEILGKVAQILHLPVSDWQWQNERMIDDPTEVEVRKV